MAKLWQFLQGHPNPYFQKKYKGGTKGIFSKIAEKNNLAWKAQKNTEANGTIL